MSESAADAGTNKDKNTTGSAPASGTPNTAEDGTRERIRRHNMSVIRSIRSMCR